MKSFRMMMNPDRYASGHWGNLALRKDEQFYIQLQWDTVTNKGVIEFRNDHTHNLLGHVPIVVESVVTDDSDMLFKRKE